MASTKIFTLFAGVNGAGKSTLFSVDTAADLGIRLNTDEIVKERVAKRIAMGWRLSPAMSMEHGSGRAFPVCGLMSLSLAYNRGTVFRISWERSTRRRYKPHL